MFVTLFVAWGTLLPVQSHRACSASCGTRPEFDSAMIRTGGLLAADWMKQGQLAAMDDEAVTCFLFEWCAPCTGTQLNSLLIFVFLRKGGKPYAFCFEGKRKPGLEPGKGGVCV